MTQIDFYTHVSQPHWFACVLANTVCNKQQRLLIWLASEQALNLFSRQLWSMGDIRFIPHCRLGAPEAPDTPIWLTAQLPADLYHPTLLNLSAYLPEPIIHFERILEIVSHDESSLTIARNRYQVYRAQGCSIRHHNMGYPP